MSESTPSEEASQEYTSDTELVGAANYDADQTKTCIDCEETSPATKWQATGPTYESENIQLAVLERCPLCGTVK